MAKYLLALDAGTTSSRAIIFDLNGKIISMDQLEFPYLRHIVGVLVPT